MLMRIVLPAFALAIAAPAVAETASIAVPHGDLDLTRDAGRKVLEARISRAATRLCGTIGARDLARIAAHRACITEARASAAPQVELALDAANARRVAVLSSRLAAFDGL